MGKGLIEEVSLPVEGDRVSGWVLPSESVALVASVYSPARVFHANSKRAQECWTCGDEDGRIVPRQA